MKMLKMLKRFKMLNADGHYERVTPPKGDFPGCSTRSRKSEKGKNGLLGGITTSLQNVAL